MNLVEEKEAVIDDNEEEDFLVLDAEHVCGFSFRFSNYYLWQMKYRNGWSPISTFCLEFMEIILCTDELKKKKQSVLLDFVHKTIMAQIIVLLTAPGRKEASSTKESTHQGTREAKNATE